MSAVKPLTKMMHLKFTDNIITINSGCALHLVNSKEGLVELKKHIKESEKFNSTVFQKSDFYFQYFNIYFGNNNYQKALESLNDWLGMSVGVERKDLESLARILNLIIHYELGNVMLLDSLVRSAQRFFK